MKDVMKKQRQARRKIIRQWTALPWDKRQSVEHIAAFAKMAVQQNEAHSSTARRDPCQKIMGWLLPRTGSERRGLQAIGERILHAIRPDSRVVGESIASSRQAYDHPLSYGSQRGVLAELVPKNGYPAAAAPRNNGPDALRKKAAGWTALWALALAFP
jgi:hypothetical protein